jgi:hypothetical protein
LPASRPTGTVDQRTTPQDRTPVAYERITPDPKRHHLPPWLVIILLIVVVVITVLILRACSASSLTALPAATVTPSPAETTVGPESSVTASPSFPTSTPSPTAGPSNTALAGVPNPALFSDGPIALDTGTYPGVEFDKNPFVTVDGNTGSDLHIGLDNDSKLVILPDEGRLSLWNGKGVPSYSSCNVLTTSDAAPSLLLKQGQIICVQTSEDRVGYMKVQSVTSTSAMFQGFVWEKPS